MWREGGGRRDRESATDLSFLGQYYSEQWLNGHMWTFCDSGSGTHTETKECMSVGRSLPIEKQREYVQQLSKGCYPNVIHNPGGGQCNLPGWPEPW